MRNVDISNWNWQRKFASFQDEDVLMGNGNGKASANSSDSSAQFVYKSFGLTEIYKANIAERDVDKFVKCDP